MSDTPSTATPTPVDILNELAKKNITAFPARITDIDIAGHLVKIEFEAYGGEMAAMLISPQQIPEIIKILFGVGVDLGVVPQMSSPICAACEAQIAEESETSTKH